MSLRRPALFDHEVYLAGNEHLAANCVCNLDIVLRMSVVLSVGLQPKFAKHVCSVCW